MSADSDAFKVVQTLGLAPAEEQYLMPVARGEGFYGLGWGTPNQKTIDESAQFGIDPRAGVGSNNWGAEQGSGSAGSFPHLDHHADGSPYVGNYKKHRTPAEGAASVARILLKPNVKAALRTGFYPGPTLPKNPTPTQRKHFEIKQKFAGQTIEPIRAAVYSQHDNGYFELNPDSYLAAVKKNYGILTAALKWPDLLSSPPAKIVETIATSPLVGGPSASESPAISSGEPCKLPRKHVVQKGDTLSKIAQLYTGNGARWSELRVVNQDKQPAITVNIWPGEVLNIPESWL